MATGPQRSAATPSRKRAAAAPATGSRSAPKPRAAKAAKAAGATSPPKPAPLSKAPKAGKAGKAAKPPKMRIKLVRDGFTMPETDFALVATLKARVLGAGREVKKSELLRAGLHALSELATPTLVAALEELKPMKKGRPAKKRG